MAITWTQDLETGLDWQDRQHKELFARINKFVEAMSKGKGREEVLNLFGFLESYVVTHFGSEEGAMGKINHPEKDSHRKEHELFKRTMAQLKDDFLKGNQSENVIRAQRSAVDWLINHIGKVDKKLGKDLKAAGVTTV